MSATDKSNLPSRWRSAVANLHLGLDRLQGTADAIKPGGERVQVDLTSPSVHEAVARHVRCLADYGVALNCVLALLHQHGDKTRQPGAKP